MHKVLGLSLVSILVFVANIYSQQSQQNQTGPIGALVVEESILNQNHKQAVFIVTQDITSSATVNLQTVSSEGIIHSFPSLVFEHGLTKGQKILVWNGEFSLFSKTSWLKFDVSITWANSQSLSSYRVAIGQSEFYKEPQILSILDQTSYSEDKRFLVMGNFDTRAATLLVINDNMFVGQEQMAFLKPGVLEMRLTSKQSQSLIRGKFLLTICQNSDCDTMVGRSR